MKIGKFQGKFIKKTENFRNGIGFCEDFKYITLALSSGFSQNHATVFLSEQLGGDN